METVSAPAEKPSALSGEVFEAILDGLDPDSLEIDSLTPESPKKVTIFNNGFDSVRAVIDSVKRLGHGDEWIGAWYTVTDKNFVEAACEAVMKGARITLYVDYYTLSPQCSGGKDALESLSKGGVAVYVFSPVGKNVPQDKRPVLHTKMALITKGTKKTVIQGSANLTKAASTVNNEMITHFPDDDEAYATLKNFIDTKIAPKSLSLADCFSIPDSQEVSLTKLFSGSQSIKTPKKGSHSILPSSDYNIQSILAERIEKTGKNGEIIVFTMTLSSYAIIDSLIKSANNGSLVQLLIDAHGAEKFTPILWDRLKQLDQTRRAQILISAKKEGLQHAKSIAIMRSPNQYIIASGTGNLVYKDDSMANVWDISSTESPENFMNIKRMFVRESESPGVLSYKDYYREFAEKRPASDTIVSPFDKKTKT